MPIVTADAGPPSQPEFASFPSTGKEEQEAVTAVEANHDTDLYNLTVKTSTGTDVIHTTSNYLYWAPYLDKFIPADHLKKGEHLKTPDGSLAVADGGTTPKVHDGWMWDLTVPGNNDHDFYVLPAESGSNRGHYYVDGGGVTAVLVHNCDTANPYDLKPTHEISGDASTKRVVSMRNQMQDRTFDWETNPIAIAKQDDDMYVVDGHHRLAAAKLVGLDSVPVVDVTDQIANGGYLGYTDMQDVLDSASTFIRNRLNQYKLR